MNMQFRQRFSRAKPFRLKTGQKKPDFVWLFLFLKKSQKYSQIARISKSGFKKAKLATVVDPTGQGSTHILGM